MTVTQYLDTICQKLNIDQLPDRLLTTYLEAIAKNQGVDTDALPNRLASTYLNAILKARGVHSVPDDLVTTKLEALLEPYGVTDLPGRTIGILLEAINDVLDMNVQVIQFTITGTEAFTFQSANNTLYYKNSDFVSIPHDDIIFATCTHFNWGDGGVIADMRDGEFIFNYTKSSGIGTGNVSFKNDALFTSASVGKDWFREQYANGTPVIVTAYIRKG